jgi:hypothetical protein
MFSGLEMIACQLKHPATLLLLPFLISIEAIATMLIRIDFNKQPISFWIPNWQFKHDGRYSACSPLCGLLCILDSSALHLLVLLISFQLPDLSYATNLGFASHYW